MFDRLNRICSVQSLKQWWLGAKAWAWKRQNEARQKLIHQASQSGKEISAKMNEEQKMHRIDQMCSHLWMVRTFLKHSEEAEEDEELCEVHRDLYDFMLALGPAFDEQDAGKYLKLVRKKLKRLNRARELFHEIQPEISEHMNFKMANRSLQLASAEIIRTLDYQDPGVCDDR